MSALTRRTAGSTSSRTARSATGASTASRSARLVAAVQSRAAAGGDAGMTTAEYAVGTVAACGFSGVLYKVVTSPSVLELVKAVIGKALNLSF